MSKYQGQLRLKRSETVGDEAGGRSRGAELMSQPWTRAMNLMMEHEEVKQRGRKREVVKRKRTDKGDSDSQRRRSYTRAGGGRQVIEEEEGQRRYRGEIMNINRSSGLSALTHSAPNAFCLSDLNI